MVASLNEDVEDLSTTTAAQSEKLQEQDKQLHTAYYCFGTAKELKDQKILSGGGLFAKSKVLQNGFNKDYFISIDIREVKEIPLFAGKAKLKSNHPEGSYEFVKDEDGNYRITGRIKDMIIRGGENIYPREIEEFLYQLEGVKDVQVAGIPSKKYGEAVGAFIILHEGVDMHESDVRDFCIGKISRYKIPKYIFFIKEFPMTGSGKIQKFKLKDLGLQLCKEQGIEIV